MNPTLTTAPGSAASSTSDYFPLLAEPLDRVELLIRKELRSDVPNVAELLTYVANLGGKRMRPALLLLAAEATGGIRDAHIVLSAVIEMIHIATLVHDDILDDADTRRHQPTINRRWDNQRSVLLGDYLFTHSFYLASTLDTTYACRRIGTATNAVCAGEMRQVGQRGNVDLSEEEYYEIIRGKTAELCACAAHLGAHYAGADASVAEAMEKYGLQLGIAFQIADDLLDLVGDEQATGKSLGRDIEMQKLTLPLIHLRRTATGADATRVLQCLENPGPDSSQMLTALLQDFGCVGYARHRAAAAAAEAARQLDKLAPSWARDTLLGLTEFVVARSS